MYSNVMLVEHYMIQNKNINQSLLNLAYVFSELRSICHYTGGYYTDHDMATCKGGQLYEYMGEGGRIKECPECKGRGWNPVPIEYVVKFLLFDYNFRELYQCATPQATSFYCYFHDSKGIDCYDPFEAIVYAAELRYCENP